MVQDIVRNDAILYNKSIKGNVKELRYVPVIGKGARNGRKNPR